MDRLSADEVELLRACVREHDWDAPVPEAALLPHVRQDVLVRCAELHRISGCVEASLSTAAALDPGTVQMLHSHKLATVAAQLRAEADLRLIHRLFHKRVPWLVVKGPVLARVYYARCHLRTYVDLDILVQPARLAEALDLLQQGGFTLLDRNWTMLLERLSGELHLVSPHHGMIDLHWDLFNDVPTRRSFALRTESFFERSRQVRIGDTLVNTLDELDTVIHTALHAARSGGDRLVWMKDLEQTVLHRQFEYDELAERCAEHHARLPVAVMLQRTKTTLDVAGLPQRALVGIGGSTLWRAAGRIVDRVAPVTRATPQGSLTRMYARATRADGRQTLRELTRRLGARAARRGLRADVPTWDSKHPQSVLFNAGGEATKSRFLERIARI